MVIEQEGTENVLRILINRNDWIGYTTIVGTGVEYVAACHNALEELVRNDYAGFSEDGTKVRWTGKV